MTPPLRAAEERRETPPSAPVVAPLAAGESMSAAGRTVAPAAKLAALARKSSPSTRLTYRGGADGHGDRGATLTDCSRCGQAVRVELRGGRLTARCCGGCGAEQLLEALDTTRVAAELRRAAG